jgi:hypothetical protein
VSLLIAIPEHQVPLNGRGRPSQCDLWALLRAGKRHLSLAVEAKTTEAFDKTVADWNRSQSEGKSRRPQFLRDQLKIGDVSVDEIRYQLLHRTVASLLEARRWGATAAIMMVQSFAELPSDPPPGWSDFQEFARLLGAPVKQGEVAPCTVKTDIPLLLGWADSQLAPDDLAAKVV